MEQEAAFSGISGEVPDMFEGEIHQVIDAIRRDEPDEFGLYPYDHLQKLTMNVDLTLLPVSLILKKNVLHAAYFSWLQIKYLMLSNTRITRLAKFRSQGPSNLLVKLGKKHAFTGMNIENGLRKRRLHCGIKYEMQSSSELTETQLLEWTVASYTSC